MSDLDTLVVTFQTQLLDVMETVVKTAMYEVTRLVEDGLLEEVQRRNREVESLRMQLQRAERKLSDQGGKEGGKTGRCVHCAKDDVELSTHSAKERPTEQQDDILGGCGVKEEGDYVERWTISRTQDVIPESTQGADNAASTLSLERKSQTTEDNVLPADVDGKEEKLNKPSCSFVHSSGPLEGEAGPESHSDTEKTEAQLKQTQENSEELLRGVFKQDPQISAAYVFPEDQEETYVATDPSMEVDSCWPLTQTEHERSNSVTAAVHVPAIPGRDQLLSSASPKARPANGDASGVTIKREVIVDSDDCVESEPQEEKTTKSGMASFSCSVKQCRVSSETLRQNHISHKATAHEVMKLHSKVGTDVRLQSAMQHLNRPMKKDSSAAAPPVARSQGINLNPLNRTPSTSKAAAPPHSAQRVQPGDKQAAVHNRTNAPWISIKTHQSANSHPTNPSPHSDSHPHASPRHLLRCGQCGKCFPHPSNLKAHLQTHTGERPFCCSLCGRSFTKLSNLKAHRRVHTGERPYCCSACGKRFTQKCNLKRHQRIHLDV
ncbi:zinc finger and BTB domain-containing protein 18 [Etheostoma cragini]|uniref:zinc finger and BTB domain-containing protein 18 n=1 Tax=Etheostoma cragini TaxID=417921 RepID=UPI00155EF9D9|nr:zinc finger and BTB domain-containing protein 18 [Etheostoma cragini]